MTEGLRQGYVGVSSLDKWIIGFSALFIVGLFNEHLTAVRNLGLYTALLLAMIKLITQRQEVLAGLRGFVANTRVPLILLLLFSCSILISSLFSYTQTNESVLSLFNETKLMMVFFVIVLLVGDRKRLLQWIVYAMVVAIALGSWHFLIKDMPALSELDASFRVSRNYANYYEYLFPFAFYQLFFEKRAWIKALIAAVLLFGMMTLLLSGVRGAWLAVVFESVIVLGYVIYFNWASLNKLLPLMVIGILIVSSFVIFTLEFTNVREHALERGTVSLGVREIIVKERLPIFMEHGDKVSGLGHGGSEYHQFMLDHDAPRRIGRHEQGGFVFNRDEPYVIQLFLHFGISGLILAVMLLGYMAYDLLRINKHVNLCGVAVLAGLVGVFGIRGLFEGRYLSGLLFIVILYIIQRSLVNGSGRTSSELAPTN